MTKVRNIIVGLVAPLAMLTSASAQTAKTAQVARANVTPIFKAEALAKMREMAKRPINKGIVPISSLKSVVDWCLKPEPSGGFNFLTFYLTSNNGNNLVSYTQGALIYDASTGLLSTNAWGASPQLFNDRVWQAPRPADYPPDLLWISDWNPFDPKKPDKLGVSIDVAKGTMTLVLKSWGNTSGTAQLQYQNNVHYGFGTSGGANPNLYTITFKQQAWVLPH